MTFFLAMNMKQAHSEITITTQSRLLLLHGLKKVYNRDSKKKKIQTYNLKKKMVPFTHECGEKLKTKKNWPIKTILLLNTHCKLLSVHKQQMCKCVCLCVSVKQLYAPVNMMEELKRMK